MSSFVYMRDGKVVNEWEGGTATGGTVVRIKPKRVVLNSDLIGCATDLVLCRESGFEAVSTEDGFEVETTLQDVRQAAARYLIDAFITAQLPDED